MLHAAASDLCPYEQLSDPGAGLAAVLIAAAASGFAAADFGTVPLPLIFRHTARITPPDSYENTEKR